ncbi:hypothetical protein REPUB_Repub19eG0093600 [Reevesia pubescens]
MTKTDGWVVRFGLGLLVASLFLFTSPSSSQETRTKGEQGKPMASQGSEGGSSNSSDDWDFSSGTGNDPEGKWTYSWGKGSGPGGSTFSYGSAAGLSPDGSRFGYGWGSSSSAGNDGSPPYGGGSGDKTGPGLGLGNGCACCSTSSINSDGSNNFPPGSGVVGEDPWYMD